MKIKEALKHGDSDGNLLLKCKLYGITAFAVIAASVAFYFAIERNANIFGFLGSIISAIAPIITGFIIAFLLNPVVIALEKLFNKRVFLKLKNRKFAEKLSKYLSIALSIIFMLGVITVIFLIIIPNLVSSISELSADLPDKAKNAYIWLRDFVPQDILTKIETKTVEYLNKILTTDLFKSFEITASYFASGMKGIYNFLINVTVGIISSFYILSGKNYFKKISQKILCIFFSKKAVFNIVSTAKKSHKMFTNYIVGTLLDSLIMALLCFIGMSIFSLPYAPLVSFTVGVTNIIPFFGPFIGAGLSVVLIFLNSPIKALYFIIMIIVLQQIDGNIICPRVMHSSLGISPFWVVFSIMLFGGLFGIIGMIIGAPLFAVIYNIVSSLVNGKLKKKGYPTDDEFYKDITKSLK